VVAAGEWLVFPSGLMSDPMVMSADGDEMVDPGGSAFRPEDAMVEATVGGGHPTSREQTSPVPGLDLAALGGRRPPAGGAVADGETSARIGQSPPPLRTVVAFGYLPCDVGDDRSIPGQPAGSLRQTGQGLHVDMKINNSTTGDSFELPAFQEV